MCGRFVLFSAFDVIARVFGLPLAEVLPLPSYNIAPGRDIAIIVSEGGRKRLTACRWGFVPAWGRDLKEGHKMINARAEAIADKPAFRDAFDRRRCLVVADGFYEWKVEGGKRKPVYVRRRSGEPFGMAGLYGPWTSPEGETICTATIVTTEANNVLMTIHDRMPAILAENDVDLWLDQTVRENERLLQMLRPYPDHQLDVYEVTSKVNSPKNDTKENIERAPEQNANQNRSTFDIEF